MRFAAGPSAPVLEPMGTPASTLDQAGAAGPAVGQALPAAQPMLAVS
jgi:hypothetical protein